MTPPDCHATPGLGCHTMYLVGYCLCLVKPLSVTLNIPIAKLAAASTRLKQAPFRIILTTKEFVDFELCFYPLRIMYIHRQVIWLVMRSMLIPARLKASLTMRLWMVE